MKRSILLIIIALATISFSVPAYAQSKFDKWPELKSFHHVMSNTFHPMEEGNLKPIRERSGEMAEKAKVLASSKIPDEFNNKDVQKAVADLERDSKKLDEMIKNNATDDEIKKSLSALHDTFHVIVEKCVKDDKDHDHEKQKHE